MTGPMTRAAGDRSTPATKAERDAVSAKVSKLLAEGKGQDEAVATALSMFRAGRIGPRK